jgi:hypothetical protein
MIFPWFSNLKSQISVQFPVVFVNYCDDDPKAIEKRAVSVFMSLRGVRLWQDDEAICSSKCG